MIDIYCIYHITYPIITHTTRKILLDMDLMCPIFIKIIKAKIKAMSHDLSSYAILTRPYKFRQISITLPL